MKEKVYLAGTDDVKWVLEKLYDKLIESSYEPIWFHKNFPISSEDTMEECLKNVNNSDRFILVLDKRYGLKSRDKEISITEEEFLTAYRKSCPILVFITSETYDQSKMYHMLKKQKENITLKKLKESGFKAEKNLYEFIEKIQHMKNEDHTKICWIESFNYISDILEQIEYKWGIKKDIQFESFIAPWVLPYEEIPIHISWNQDFEYEYIKIEYPVDLKLVEVVNVKDYKIMNSSIIIFKNQLRCIMSEDLFHNYFGVVFLYENISFPQLKLFKDISVCFINNSDVIKKINLIAKIFRPELKNISRLSLVILKDDTSDYSIPIILECVGFGFISIYIEVKINKFTISFKESILERIEKKLKRKYGELIEKFEENEFEQKLKTSISSIEHFLKAYNDYLLNTNEDKPSLSDYLTEEDVELTLIFDFFIELFNEIKIQHKFENVLLKSTSLELPKEQFNEFIKDIIIFVHYEDLKNNKYPPIEIPLEINDIREKPQHTTINFKIKVNDIIDNSYHDIENIKRE